MARASRADVPFDAPAGSFGPGHTATETARHRSAQRAYKAGVEGQPFSQDTSDPLPYDDAREFYEQGRSRRLERSPDDTTDAGDDTAEPVDTAEPPAPVAVPAARPSSSSSPVNDGAGFVLGLIVYAMVLNYLQGGTAQARGWLAAKFLNRPFTRATTTAAAPSKPDVATATPAAPVHLVTVPTP